MRKQQWLSSIRNSIVGKKTRSFRRKNRRQPLRFQSLEQRNLLASVSLSGTVLTFSGTLEADIVSVSATPENALQIQVGAGDSISLGGGAIDNSAFVLSQSTVTNDTLTISGASSFIEQLVVNLSESDDIFTATSLAGIESPAPDADFGRSLVVSGNGGLL